MTQRVFSLLPAALLAAALTLSACENSEARAERHFNSGMALLEAGETSQALLEFRNVLRLQPTNIEARMQIARVYRGREQFGEAFREFTQVVERDPDNFEARLALAEIALMASDWAAVERHGRAAQRLQPDDQRVALIVATLDYRDAISERDRAGTDAPAEAVRSLIDHAADTEMAWRLLIDHALAEGTQLERGLEQIEEALANRPDVLEFHELQLQVLVQLGRMDRVRSALEAMLERFPDHGRTERLYVRFLLEEGDTEAAEAYMRQRTEREGAGFDEARELVEFVGTQRGLRGALDEIDRLIEAGGDAARLGAMRARLLFETGDFEGAIAELRKRIDETEDAELRNDLRVTLAQYLGRTGSPDEANALVETVLADDGGHVEALKQRAARLIVQDRTSEAISALRLAQAAAPRDPAIMMLMGQAHDREGARDLAGERFAQAVEMSDNAPRPSIMQAEFLLRGNRLDAADAVLTSALNRNPNNLELLSAMAETQLRIGAWDRVQRLIWHLRGLDTPAATRVADAVEADMLLRQGRTGDTISFLEGLVRDGGELAALAALVQAQVREGQVEGAVALVEELKEERPDDLGLLFLRAGLHVLSGEVATAEAIYRDLVQQVPNAEPPFRALYSLLQAQGRLDEAHALLDDVRARLPDAVMPQLLEAARLERAFDIEGAIAIYERLYAADSSNLIVANNLASLLSAHRDDDESVERAHTIARRLRGTDFPPFQDTYGWIQHRRGNYDEALAYLEPAAASLPNDPLVQFHLGMTYFSLQRHDEARDVLGRAIEIAGDAPLPQFDRARELLNELDGN